MSKIELLAKIELLNKYEAMIDEMKSEAESIRLASATRRKTSGRASAATR